MAKKNKNSRKALAIALGVMGIAGLSLASAATLVVDTSNEVAVGVGTFAACDADGAVDVAYTYDSATLKIEDISVTGISAACDGEDIFLQLEDAAAAELASTTGVVAAGAFTYDASGDSIDVATDLGDVTVVIG